MIRRIRLVVLVARPAVIILLMMFAGVGLAQAGAAADKALLASLLAGLYLGFIGRILLKDFRDVTAIAIVGRGMILLLLAHLSMVAAGWSALRYDAAIGTLGLVIAGQAASMVRHGPFTGCTIPIADQLAAHREILVRSTSSGLTSSGLTSSRGSTKMARPA